MSVWKLKTTLVSQKASEAPLNGTRNSEVLFLVMHGSDLLYTTLWEMLSINTSYSLGSNSL